VSNLNEAELDRAFLWLTEEVGELAHIVRKGMHERYKDGVGDIVMWCITIANMVGVSVADALEYSTEQLVNKGYTKLPRLNDKIDPPLPG
jgi:NTP pyrophosphatase (non-canonical NTP hydrolase)